MTFVDDKSSLDGCGLVMIMLEISSLERGKFLFLFTVCRQVDELKTGI